MMHAIDDPRQKYWYPSWIEPDPNYRKARTGTYQTRAIDSPRNSGAKCVTTEPGGPVHCG